MVAELADGVIVGSALVKVVQNHADSDHPEEAVREFAASLISAVRSAGV
jgi:tryptophan synthase alpha subunit